MQENDERIREFRHRLLNWWKSHQRKYPWREKRTPYRVAVAEMMLRRTQADQVVPVFETFLEKYPDLKAASQADADEVRQVLYPLGLAWRADSTIAFLRNAYRQYGNDLPLDLGKLKELPGVGDYVGAAIVCFAGGQNVPLIDTNVVRVLGRVFGVSTYGEARRRKDVRELARQAVDPAEPVTYHYAILDFAAKICRPKLLCSQCPLAAGNLCTFYQAQKCS